MTAKHVVEGDKVRLTTKTEVVEVPIDKITELEMIDAVLIKDVVVPGVAQAKLAAGALADGLHLQVEICNGTQKSYGPLKTSQVFGEVLYSGSTVAGFSGAPYFAGRFVYGMHVGASSVNFGYEASWLKTVAIKEEDSDQFFLDKIMKGDLLQYKRSPYDPDEVFIRTGRGYAVLDAERFFDTLTRKEKMEEARLATAWEDFRLGDAGEAQAAKAYLDRAYESCKIPVTQIDDNSGNVKLPAAVVLPSAGPSRISPPNAQNGNLQTCQEIGSTVQSPVSKSETTDLHQLMLARKNAVSPSTLTSILEVCQDWDREARKELLEGLNLMFRKEKELLKRQRTT